MRIVTGSAGAPYRGWRKLAAAVGVSAGVLTVLLGGRRVYASDWEIDSAQTSVSFTLRRAGGPPMKGSLGRVEGQVQMDDIDPYRSTFQLVIAAGGVSTGDAARDEYLKSPEILDAAGSPEIMLKSSKAEKVGKNRYKVSAAATLRGLERPVTFLVRVPTEVVKDSQGHFVRRIAARGTLSRKAWGLAVDGPLARDGLSNDVVIEANLVLVLANPGGDLAR